MIIKWEKQVVMYTGCLYIQMQIPIHISVCMSVKASVETIYISVIFPPSAWRRGCEREIIHIFAFICELVINC